MATWIRILEASNPGLMAGGVIEPYCYLPALLQGYILEATGHMAALEAALQRGVNNRMGQPGGDPDMGMDVEGTRPRLARSGRPAGGATDMHSASAGVVPG